MNALRYFYFLAAFLALSASAQRCPYLFLKRPVRTTKQREIDRILDADSRARVREVAKVLQGMQPLGLRSEPTEKGERFRISPRRMSAAHKQSVGAAYRAFLRAELGRDEFRALPAPERREFLRSLALAASAYLQRHGVRHEIVREKDHWFLVIAPDPSHQLGRAAQKLQTGLGGQLVFDPRFLAVSGAAAALDPDRKILFLAFNDLPYLVREREALPHELQHVQGLIDAVEGVARGDYGRFAALDDSELPGNFQHYFSYCSADEMTTYRGDGRRALAHFRASWKELREHLASHGADAGFFRHLERAGKHWDSMTISVQFARGIADRMNLIGQWTKTMAAEVPVSFRTGIAGVVEARFRFDVKEKSQFRFLARVPLAASSGVRDPRNRELLVQQLAALGKTGQAVKSHANELLRFLEKHEPMAMPYSSNGEPDAAALVRQVERAMPEVERLMAQLDP